MSKLSAYKKMIDYDFSFKKTLGKTAKIFVPNRKNEQIHSSFKEADVVVLGLENLIASCEDAKELKEIVNSIKWEHDVTLMEDYNKELMTASQTVIISPFRSVVRSKNKKALSFISDSTIEERLKVELGEKILFDILSCDDENFVSRVAPVLSKIIKSQSLHLNITPLLIELDSNEIGLKSIVQMHNMLKEKLKVSFTATPLSPSTTTFLLKSKIDLPDNSYVHYTKEKHFFDYLDSSLLHAVSYLEKRVADNSIYSGEVIKDLYSGLSNRLYNKGTSYFESKAFFAIQNKIVGITENFNGYDKNKAFLEECNLKLLCRKFYQPEKIFSKFSSIDFSKQIYFNVIDKALKPSQIEGLNSFFKEMQIENPTLYFRIFSELFKHCEKSVFDSSLIRKVRKGECSIEELVLEKMNNFINEVPLDFNMFLSFVEKEPVPPFKNEKDKEENLVFLKKLSNQYFKNSLSPSSAIVDFKHRF